MDEPLIPFKLQIFAVAFSIILLVFIIELIRKNRLKEGYSILWFLIGISLLVISVWTDLLRGISQLVAVEYEPAMLLTVLMLGVIVLMIHFSILVSKFDHNHKSIVQNLGFINWELTQLRAEVQRLKGLKNPEDSDILIPETEEIHSEIDQNNNNK